MPHYSKYMTPAEAIHLFDAQMRYTVNVEYGFSFAQSMNNEPIPEHGARFDVFFEGEILGERLQGKVHGVDYVSLGTDRVARLHIHAHIITTDGCHIAVHAEGVAKRRAGSPMADFQETLSFATSSERYKWLNHVRAFGSGTADTQAGISEVRVMEGVPPKP
jgi:hypothetical protein